MAHKINISFEIGTKPDVTNWVIVEWSCQCSSTDQSWQIPVVISVKTLFSFMYILSLCVPLSQLWDVRPQKVFLQGPD